MKKSISTTDITVFFFYLFSMIYFIYGLWTFVACLNEIRSLISEGVIELGTDTYKIVSYMIVDQGLGASLFYCMALCGLATLLKRNKECCHMDNNEVNKSSDDN